MSKICSKDPGGCIFQKLNDDGQCVNPCAYKLKEAKRLISKEIRVGSPMNVSTVDSSKKLKLHKMEGDIIAFQGAEAVKYDIKFMTHSYNRKQFQVLDKLENLPLSEIVCPVCEFEEAVKNIEKKLKEINTKELENLNHFFSDAGDDSVVEAIGNEYGLARLPEESSDDFRQRVLDARRDQYKKR